MGQSLLLQAMKSFWIGLLCLSLSWMGLIKPGFAANQTQIGEGNALAIQLSQGAPIVQSAQALLVGQAQQIADRTLRTNTTRAISDPKFCIQHRAGLTDATKTKLLQQLTTEGLVDIKDDATFPGGLKAGIFPPVQNDGSRCPQMPQPFFSAPGSAFGGHHSNPGGLVVHELFNSLNGQSLANLYRQLYGHHDRQGLAIAKLSDDAVDVAINNDVTIAAPLWHDWAKTLVFQWVADGTEFAELNFGGNGTTDNNGQPGSSKTGAHHILGLAESIQRQLSPELVITQASAHAAPTLGNEYKVVNWIRTGAMLAQVDPVAAGYLVRDGQKQLRLPPLYQLGSLNLNDKGQTNLLVEYAIHNLSDADYVFSIPAVSLGETILKSLAAEFGYRAEDATVFNTKFRNPVFTNIPAERLVMLYDHQGIEGVRSAIKRLHLKR
jgi:hypothetical protein